MKEKKDRIIIDTNLWISYLLSTEQKGLDSILKSKSVTLIFSYNLLEEFIEVAKRPKFKKYFDEDNLESILETINSISEFIHTTTEINLCRDPKDDFLLELAIDGRATHLITGDKDLLTLKKIESTKILTISDYLLSKH